MITALNGPPAGRVAIVTGGSRGVGRATIGLLAARDYAVVVNYLHDQ
jgi:3-oxoacyl-[acyl-carrier protein] reductase